MKKIFLLATIILIWSCENKTTETRYYPSYREIQKDSVEIIGLDTTKLNFLGITNRIGTYYENYQNLVVEFDDGQIKKRLTPHVYDGGLIRFKNYCRLQPTPFLLMMVMKLANLNGFLNDITLIKAKSLNIQTLQKKPLLKLP